MSEYLHFEVNGKPLRVGYGAWEKDGYFSWPVSLGSEEVARIEKRGRSYELDLRYGGTSLYSPGIPSMRQVMTEVKSELEEEIYYNG